MEHLTTLRDLFQQTVNTYPHAPFLKIWDGETYLCFSYQEIFSLVQKLGAGLCKLGIKPGEKFVLLGENSPAWVVCYLALVCGGWVVVPLDKELKPKELSKLIKYAEAKYIFISRNMLNKFEGIKLRNTKFYVFDPFLQVRDDLSELMVEDKHWQRLYAEASIQGSDLASIVFTSGTTGTAKGVMLTHYNFVSDIIASCNRIDLSRKDVMLLILPLHHTFPLTAGFFIPMYKGARIIIENSKTRVLKTLQEQKPTVLIGVPRFYQLLYDRIESEVRKRGRWKQWQKALNLVKKVKQKTSINIGRLIFRKLHKQLGGKVRLFVSGGAPLSSALAHKYYLLGIPLLQGWGMTELSPVGSILPYSKWRFYFTRYYEERATTIGPPLDGVKIELIDVPEKGLYANLGLKKGELVVSGPIVTPGYYKDEEANQKVFIPINGGIWFRTGDIGKKDAESNLYITGRGKYIIVTPEGKNVHPEEVEDILNQSPLIQESLVLGHKEHQGERVVAIIAPHAKNLKNYLKKAGLKFTWENIYEVIYKEMQTQLKQISNYKWPSDFALTEYNEETEEFEVFEKTTTFKIKREPYKFSSFHSYRSLKKGGWRKIFFKKLE
ncbi:MAG: AMP-binding protein [Candidatus Desulfofervidaceae bacterium]|nr:AMP-binding protein [Candidatus Desulfofervidaceae bacterium]